MRARFRKSRFFALALLLVAGCQSLPSVPWSDREPQPQAVGTAVDDPLPPRRGRPAKVMVAPVQGVPNTLSRQITALIVEGLEQQGLPATARSTPDIVFTLEGTARRNSIVWRLRSPEGLVAGRFSESVSQGNDREKYPDAASPEFAELARRVAGRTGSLVTEYEANPPLPGEARETVDAAPLEMANEDFGLVFPNLAVLPVDGAPGDGRTELPRAMRDVLRKSGIPVLAEPGDDTYLLLGDVFIAENSGDTQMIEITWMLLLPNGETLGSIRQNNEVPRGALAVTWREIATAVAEGAAEGVISLLSAAATPKGAR